MMDYRLTEKDEYALVEERIQKGELKELYSLVCDNLISIESAAARKNMTVNEFLEKSRKLDIV